MIVILAIDALELEKVEEFNCKNLEQKYYGKTDISEFSEPRTMVLWSSFITGENKEKEVLSGGNKEMWNKTFPLKKTFFSKFKNPEVIDLPGFSYDLKAHEKSRLLLKEYFESETNERKEKVKSEYNKNAFEHHKKVKTAFFEALNSGKHDLILGYFSIIDVIGHLSFGNNSLMKMLYKEMDEIALEIKKHKDAELLVISDHGMKLIGSIFGDHSNYGFWSYKKELKNPKITEFANLL